MKKDSWGSGILCTLLPLTSSLPQNNPKVYFMQKKKKIDNFF